MLIGDNPMPYYIVEHGDNLDLHRHHAFNTFGAAQQYASEANRKSGKHYHVLELKTAWTTTTLHDLMQDNRRKD